MTITEFLLARITEDEAAVDVEGTFGHPNAHSLYDTPLQRWDYDQMMIGPGRMLAECEAKRRIVTLAWAYSDGPESPRTINLANDVLHHMALPYADHPDFDPAWSQ